MEPTLPTLRPLRFGELFDQAIRLYRRNFLTFVGIISVVYIPYLVLQTATSTFFLARMQEIENSSEIIMSPAYWLFIFSTLVGTVLYLIFVNGLGTAALTYATARSYLNQNINIIDSYRQLGTSWLHLLFVMFTFSILTSLISTWAIIPIVGWFTGLGAIIFLSGAVEGLLPAVTIIEKQTWVAPIARAWNLARRRFWWLLGVAVVFSLFTFLISTGPALLIQTIVTTLVGSRVDTLVISTLISSVLGGLLQVITIPVLIIAKTLIYFDLRIRTEGLDLALASLEVPEGTQIELASIVIPDSGQQWLTWDDISKFAIISIGLLGIIALLVGITAILLTLLGATQ